MRHKKKYDRNGVLIAVAAWLSLAPAAWSQTSGAAFLNVTPSARAYALGLSNTVSALGAEAVGANPANLGLLTQRFEVFSSYASLISGTQYEHLAAAFAPSSIRAIDALGLSVTRLQTAAYQGADENGNKTGSSFSSGDTAVALSGAAALSSRLRLGLTVKAVQSSIAGYRSNMALAGDLGLTSTLSAYDRPISIGASVLNLGQGVRFLDQTDPLPLAANLGAAVPVGPALLVAEVNRLVLERRTTFGAGLEYGLGPVSFRGGFLAQNQSGNLALNDQSGAARLLGGLSGGIGVKLGIARFDYAVSQQAVEFGATHRVALSLQWGSASRHQDASPASGDQWRSHSDQSDWLIRSLGGY